MFRPLRSVLLVAQWTVDQQLWTGRTLAMALLATGPIFVATVYRVLLLVGVTVPTSGWGVFSGCNRHGGLPVRPADAGAFLREWRHQRRYRSRDDALLRDTPVIPRRLSQRQDAGKLHPRHDSVPSSPRRVVLLDSRASGMGGARSALSQSRPGHSGRDPRSSRL